MLRKPIIIGFLLIVLAIASQVQNRGNTAAPTGTGGRVQPTSNVYRVEYIIRGAADEADATYNNAQGGTQQDEFSRPGGFDGRPVTIRYRMEKGDFAYISVQNQGTSGDVVCQIVVNDELWRESKSTADYGIAACSGSVGDD